MQNADVFREMLMSHKPGDDGESWPILRQDKPQELTAKLGAQPANDE